MIGRNDRMGEEESSARGMVECERVRNGAGWW